MRIYSDWRWWVFVALAFVYGLAVMLAVIAFLKRSAQRHNEPESMNNEIDNRQSSAIGLIADD